MNHQLLSFGTYHITTCNMNLRIKDICKEKGITIGDLADKMQMVRESLSRAINGNPTLETLECYIFNSILCIDSNIE